MSYKKHERYLEQNPCVELWDHTLVGEGNEVWKPLPNRRILKWEA